MAGNEIRRDAATGLTGIAAKNTTRENISSKAGALQAEASAVTPVLFLWDGPVSDAQFAVLKNQPEAYLLQVDLGKDDSSRLVHHSPGSAGTYIHIFSHPHSLARARALSVLRARAHTHTHTHARARARAHTHTCA